MEMKQQENRVNLNNLEHFSQKDLILYSWKNEKEKKIDLAIGVINGMNIK